MDMREYQESAARTRNSALSWTEECTNYSLGLGGEIGELLNVVKKHIYHGHIREEVDAKISDEVGDLLWYITMLLELFNLSLEDVAENNIAKLKNRYPGGFSKEASQNRVA